MKGHEFNPDPSERAGPAPGDAELEALEAEVVPVLGARLEGFEGFEGAGSPEGAGSAGEDTTDFRASLRAAFVSGQFEGDEALETPLEDVLRSWSVPAASAGARTGALQALLTGSLEGQADDPQERGVGGIAPAPVHTGRPRRARAPERASGPRQGHFLRLAVGGSLLAAAAAVFLVVNAGRDTDGPRPEGDQNVAQTDTAPLWALDAATVAAFADTDAFEDLLVDGREITSIEELNEALASGRLVENGGETLRIRRGTEFVLELGPGTVIDLAPVMVGAPAAGRQIDVERGSVRVATGPGFNRDQPLVLRSRHVRSEVVGTVFGIDVTEDFTCVCCLLGSVHTMPTSTGCPVMDVDANSTRIVRGSGSSNLMALVEDHRGDLVALDDRTSQEGYWL